MAEQVSREADLKQKKYYSNILTNPHGYKKVIC